MFIVHLKAGSIPVFGALGVSDNASSVLPRATLHCGVGDFLYSDGSAAPHICRPTCICNHVTNPGHSDLKGKCGVLRQNR